MCAAQSFYSRVTGITEDYLGPAAARFISRIADHHLGKSSAELTPDDLPELITWVQLAANVLTENRSEIDEYIARLRTLAAAKTPKRSASFKNVASR